MTHSEQLEEMVKKIDVTHPYIKEIIKRIHEIDCMSNFEFDYQVERTAAKYRAILEILIKHKIIHESVDIHDDI
jgi:hypothetical protein